MGKETSLTYCDSDHLEAKRAFFKKEKPNFVDEVENDAPRAYPWWTELKVDLKPKVATRDRKSVV
mgnify:CR=1 FL=1